MKVKYIRRDIPEEISEEGGAYIQLVEKSTIGLTESIKEAIRMLYCVGEASLIEGYFFGLVRSVFAGIKADGAARSIGDIRFYPVCGGTFDLEKGWDPLVNDVRIKAQLVNGVELDISDWQFEDTTAGRVSFSVESVSDGSTTGQVSTNKNLQVNGKNFPTDIAASWVCGTKSGEVAASKLTRTVSRLDIDKSAFASLDESDDGKEITLTFKGSYNKVTKTVLVKYCPIAESTDGVVKVKTCAPASVSTGETITLTGTGLAKHDDTWGIMMVTSTMIDAGETVISTEIQSQSDTELVLKVSYTGEKPAGSHPSRLWVSYLPEAGGAAESLEVPYTFLIA